MNDSTLGGLCPVCLLARGLEPGEADALAEGMLSLVPGPALTDEKSFALTLAGPLQITALAVEGAGFRVDWFSIPTAVYRLQVASDLEAGPWTGLAGDVTATGNSASKTDLAPPGSGARFYRVLQVDDQAAGRAAWSHATAPLGVMSIPELRWNPRSSAGRW